MQLPRTYAGDQPDATCDVARVRVTPARGAAAARDDDARQAVSPAFTSRRDAELAWLQDLAGITPAVARVLAARIAASHAVQQPHRPATVGALDNPSSGLLADHPVAEAIHDDLDALGCSAGRLHLQDMACLTRAWPFALALDTLLASGGDERLALDPVTGLNRYGCAPRPRPEVIGFASCTASSLSPAAFDAAARTQRGLIQAALTAGAEQAVAAASIAAEAEILAHFDVTDIAEAVLAASGTDAALIVTGLLAAEQPSIGLTSVLVSPAETGSGVPEAVQGRHFAGSAPSGSKVAKGSVLEGLDQGLRLVTVALRDPAGDPVSAGRVARSCEAAIAAALPQGRVVLHAIDGSKTGLTAPDRPTLLRLAKRFGRSLDIVVDACQARIEPALVRWYLQQGFPVLVTGSKFFAAPGFCGAVLFPRARLARIAATGLVPGGLAPYARLDDGVGSRQCPGLLLRWTAALHDMARFRDLPVDEIGHRLDRLGASVGAALGQDGRFRLIAASRPDGMGWSDRRSVFTFAVRGKDGWMDAAGLRPIYMALHDDLSHTLSGRQEAAWQCQIGQPVQLGSPDLGGLRIAFSAAQIIEGGDQADALAQVSAKLRLLLDLRTRDETASAVTEPVLATG